MAALAEVAHLLQQAEHVARLDVVRGPAAQPLEHVRLESVDPVLPRAHACLLLVFHDAAGSLLERLRALRFFGRDVPRCDEPRELAARDGLVLGVERSADANALAFDGRVVAAVPAEALFPNELAGLLAALRRLVSHDVIRSLLACSGTRLPPVARFGVGEFDAAWRRARCTVPVPQQGADYTLSGGVTM